MSEIGNPDVFDASMASLLMIGVEFAEHALLQIELLRHRFDDEIAIAQIFER